MTRAEAGGRSEGGRAAALREVAALFLRLGATSLGGPAAHVALMEREVVVRRRWLDRGRFLDLLGATNLIPGPNSTEMAIHIGWARAGWAGSLAAGVGFIAPAAAITLALAWAYVRYGTRPAAEGLLYGVKPVVIAIVVDALVRLGRTALRPRGAAAAAGLTALATLPGGHELVALLGAGALLAAAETFRRGGRGDGAALLASAPVPLAAFAPAAAAGAAPFGLLPLFLFFLKVGSVLYGSGYVLLAFLRSDLVDRWGWLTDRQLLDAVAVGQATPGPVFTTATFIGYVLGGLPGAAVATVGIFLPSFVLVAASGPLVPRIRRSAVAGAFLDGVNAASLALMAVVAWDLGRAALVDAPTVALAAGAGAALIGLRAPSFPLMLAGGLVGLALGTGP